MNRILPLAALLLTVACNRDRPPAPTREQSDQLNAAEAMLDDFPQEKGPGDRSPGPSNRSD
jgi:hypothetical protein